MNPNYIDDDEILYRFNRKSYPDTWLNGRPTAALFIDPKGLSIERDGGRIEEEIVKKSKERFRRDPLSGIAKIFARICREINTCPKAIGNRRNKYHGEIHESDSEIEISLLKAKMLSDKCDVIF